MEKTGQLAVGVSRCDECGKPATVIDGQQAFCDDHRPGHAGEKRASERKPHVKSFTDPAIFKP